MFLGVLKELLEWSASTSIAVHRHCGGLFHFLRLVSNRFNKHIDRVQAEDMTLADTGQSSQKHVSHEWASACADFVRAWNAIRKYVKQYECHEIEVPYLG